MEIMVIILYKGMKKARNFTESQEGWYYKEGWRG